MRVGVALLFLATSASAQTPDAVSGEHPESGAEIPQEVESFVLTYDAPVQCPPRQSFEELAQALTSAAQFSEKSEGTLDRREESSRRLRITISERKRDFFGTLELVDEETSSRRQFDAATCVEIVEALALATALAIDPDALGAPAQAEQPEELPEQAEVTPPEEKLKEEFSERPSEPETRHHLVGGLQGTLAWIQATTPNVGQSISEARGASRANDGGVYLEWEHRPEDVWMSLHASLGYGASRPEAVDLNWAPLARVGVCPVWWEAHSSNQLAIRLAPCLGGSFGILRSEATGDVEQPQGASRRWVAFDAAVRLQAIFGPARVGLSGGVMSPASPIDYLLAGRTDEEDEVILVIYRRLAPHVGVNVGWAIF